MLHENAGEGFAGRTSPRVNQALIPQSDGFEGSKRHDSVEEAITSTSVHARLGSARAFTFPEHGTHHSAGSVPISGAGSHPSPPVDPFVSSARPGGRRYARSGAVSFGIEDGSGDGCHREQAVVSIASFKKRRPRLVTCWLIHNDAGLRTYAFCAMVTSDPAELVGRMVERYGLGAMRDARFCEGFDPTSALATAMISDALAETLSFAALEPASLLAAGLDVVVEQRFAA